MNFIRLFTVVAATTICGGLFGAAVGGLIGTASPHFLEVVFRVQIEEAEQNAERYEDASKTRRAGAGVSPRSADGLPAVGSALGASTGLILGALIGISLAVLDQIIIAVQRPRGTTANE